MLKNLSIELKGFGKGFSKSNLTYMKLLYLHYPICETVSHKLRWSHYFELLKVDNDLSRSFYEKQCIKENWSVRELKREKDSMLFERIALSKDKQGVLDMSKNGQVIEKSEDIVKEPYILEFLNIPENYKYSADYINENIFDIFNLSKVL